MFQSRGLDLSSRRAFEGKDPSLTYCTHSLAFIYLDIWLPNVNYGQSQKLPQSARCCRASTTVNTASAEPPVRFPENGLLCLQHISKCGGLEAEEVIMAPTWLAKVFANSMQMDTLTIPKLNILWISRDHLRYGMYVFRVFFSYSGLFYQSRDLV